MGILLSSFLLTYLSMQRKKSLGQCFLEDRNILRLEAKLAEPEGKIIMEIGPGDGRLTEALLELKPKKIIAVEKDARFAAVLREKFSGRDDVDIVESDFLEMEFPERVDVIVGNIPYYISSDIIFRIAPLHFTHAILMVQKEFAKKMVSKPDDDDYGRLSITSQIAFDIKFERTVLRHLFRPIPKVDSAIIVLKPTGVILSQFQENIIRWLFSHKNRTVRNALISSKEFEDESLSKLGDYLKRRVRTLTKEDVLEIADLLS